MIDLMDALKKSLGRRKEAAEAKAKNQGRLKDLAKAPKRATEEPSKGEKRARAARR